MIVAAVILYLALGLTLVKLGGVDETDITSRGIMALAITILWPVALLVLALGKFTEPKAPDA